MDPFTITCATCASRIRVRNSNLLGQLANCPKCNSMILIAAPEAGTATPSQLAADRAAATGERRGPGEQRIEVQRPYGPTVDSTALTREGLPAELVEYSASAVDRNGEDDDEYRLAPMHVGSAQTLDLPGGSMLTAPPLPTSRSNSLAADGWESAAPAHLPSSDWTSASTNRTRQILLIGFLGLAGVMLAGLIFYGFLRWHGSGSSATANQAAGAGTEVVAPIPPDSAQNVSPPVDNTVQASDQGGETTNVAGSEPWSETVGSNDVSAEPVDALSAAPTSDTNLSGAAEDDSAIASDVDSNSSDLTKPPLELPKQLQAFMPMLQVEIQPQFSDATEILSEAPVTAEDLGLTTTLESIEVPAVDVETQAKLTVPALVMKEMPLSQFVSLWSNLSGIPTVVNLDSLAAAGIDRNQSIGMALVKSATIGSLVDRLGEPLGLESIVHDNSYVELSASNEAMQQLLPEAVELAGLVPDTDEAWLIESLSQLFPEQQLPWKTDAGKLLRPHSDAGEPLDAIAWSAVVRLIGGWRQSAGLPTTLPNYEPALLAGTLVGPSDVAGLEHMLKRVQPEARPLSQTIPRICREAGVHVWIDWPAVAKIGLGPQSSGLVLTNARPLRRALADYVLDFPFVLAVLDKQTLWLTSNQTYRATPRHFVLPSNGLSIDEWKTRLRPLTPVATGGVGVGSVVVIATHDEKFVLVRCCPMQVDLQL